MLWAIHPYEATEGVVEASRKIFARECLSALKLAVRGSGWQKRENVLFRRLSDHFVSVELKAASNQPLSWIEVRIKPFELDPLLWQITETDSRDWPLFARAFFSASCRAPIFRKIDWNDAGVTPQGNVARLLAALDGVLSMIEELAMRSYADFVDAVDTFGDFTTTRALSLILEEREVEALTYSEECLRGHRKVRSKMNFLTDSGAQTRDVHELIIDWIRTGGTRLMQPDSEGD